MSFREHVSNQKGEKSTIKGLIDEIIKEIEIWHGLVSFPAREVQEENESELNCEKEANYPTTFQNVLEGRVSKIELVLAAFWRQDEEWKVKYEKREREWRQDFERDRQQHREIIDIQEKLGFHDMKLAEQDSRVGDLEAQVTSLRIGLDGLENQVASMELSRMADQGEFHSEESDETAGLPAAAKAKSGGVTFRPGQLRMEEQIQRVAAGEKQTERLTEAHAGQRDVMVSHGQQIGRLSAT